MDFQPIFEDWFQNCIRFLPLMSQNSWYLERFLDSLCRPLSETNVYSYNKFVHLTIF